MVLLITQSGGASAIEGIFYRLPMITMPIGFDQERTWQPKAECRNSALSPFSTFFYLV